MGHKIVCSAMCAIGILAGALYAVPARADGPPFDLPVDCPYGECDIVHYVDHDAGPGIRDFACGTSTYDGHRGTDFAIPDEEAMINGVAALSVADGVVSATRDGVEDIDAGRLNKDALSGIECGNGILIDHDDGWQSQYCHLRRGSIAVRKGDRVSRGQTIGLIGMSGQATFPHLHFNLRQNDKLIDPFSGTDMADPGTDNCAANQSVLWTPQASAQMTYRPVHLYALGFSSGRPNATDIKRGYDRGDTLPATSPALYFWGYLIGVNDGDIITLNVSGPRGFNGSRDFTIKLPNDNGPRAKWFYVNADRPGDQWRSGTYQGRILFSRDGKSPVEIGSTELHVP